MELEPRQRNLLIVGALMGAVLGAGTAWLLVQSVEEDPERPKLSLATRANTYPKWDRREGRVITLGQKINQMIVRMLKGKAEELGSERLVAIEAYLMKISRDR